MPQWPDVATLELILQSGINVVTTARLVTGAHYPDDAGQRLASAAAAGGASLYGAGMNPMHVPNVALAATAMCREVRAVRIHESVDCAMYGAAATWEAYGFGSQPDRESLRRELARAEPDYPEALDAIAGAVGVTLDDHELTLDYATAVGDRDLGFMTIAAGTVSGLDASWIGKVGDSSFVQLRTTWRLGSIFGHDDTPAWQLLHGYRIDIDGEPDVHLKLHFVPSDLDNIDIGSTTAMPVINAIPAVCAAPAGVLTAKDLTLITARGVPT
jgi:hypothetical protein